jgi:hypothetical protein
MKDLAVSAWDWYKQDFENKVIDCDEKSKNKYLKYMVKQAISLLKKRQPNGKSILKELVAHCEEVKASHNKRIPCNELIGKLRIIFAQISLDKLEPDLVIMDEFQRFKYLIKSEEGSDMNLLTKK